MDQRAAIDAARCRNRTLAVQLTLPDKPKRVDCAPAHRVRCQERRRIAHNCTQTHGYAPAQLAAAALLGQAKRLFAAGCKRATSGSTSHVKTRPLEFEHKVTLTAVRDLLACADGSEGTHHQN